MSQKITTTDHALLWAQGCFLGLAIGDALGTSLVMCMRDRHPVIHDIIGMGPFNLPAGAWTDDTAMAIAAADSLLRCNGLDATDMMESWWRWLERGEYSATGQAIDIGKTILRCMMEYKRKGVLYGEFNERHCGNGSIMRLAPFVLRYVHSAEEMRSVVIEQTCLTHHTPMTVEAGVLMADILCAAYRGVAKDALLQQSDYPYTTQIQSLRAGDFLHKTRDEIASGGYVLESLEAALWSFYATESFEEALLMAVHLCGDSDTVGAITGQIAGAYYGVEAIPPRWLEVLFQAEKIRQYAQELYAAAGSHELPLSPTSVQAIVPA